MMIVDIARKAYRVSRTLFVKSPAQFDVRDHVMHAAERYRGEHRIDYETCIGCDACNKICPVHAITMKHLPFKKQNIVPEVNLSVCIFCGLCEDACPTKPEKSIVLSGGRYDMISGGWHADQDSFWVHVDVPQSYIDSRLEAEEADRVKKELAAKKKAAVAAAKAAGKDTSQAPQTGMPDFSGGV
jgi:NADH-quinone oxidoreductase subunit I